MVQQIGNVVDMKLPNIKAWQLVAAGVVMTIVSAILTNQVIEQNNSLIKDKKAQIRTIEQLISDNWQNSLALERKKDTLIILTQVMTNKNLIIEDFIEKLLRQSGAYNSELPEGFQESYSMAAEKIDEKRQAIGNTIDNKYIEKIGIEEQVIQLEDTNSIFQNLAFFLYTLGLILVLSKDMARD